MKDLTAQPGSDDSLGHKVLIAAIVLGAAACAVLSFQSPDWMPGTAGAVLAALGALAVWATAPRWPGTRFVLAFLLFGVVALQIQLGRGMTELHFGVFVSLAFLLVYRDWKVIVFSAAVVALHHVLFDRLQAAGLGFYCTAEADFWRVMFHAGYVVVQTAVEVVLAIQLRRVAREGEELRALVGRVRQDDSLSLDVQGLAAKTASGQVLRGAIAQMGEAVGAVRIGAIGIETASSEIASGNQDLSERTERQAHALQQTAASVEELNRTVDENATNTRRASALARTAGEVAARGGETMGDVVRRMSAITQSSNQIAEITGVIDGLAFQTNILALNASVEAARAGESGRGFSVVAAEVRQLAQRSADAARQIKQLLETSAAHVNDGAALVDQAGRTMAEIVSSIQELGDSIGHIDRSSERQRQSFAVVSQAIGQIDETTQQNAALVEQSAAAAASLRTQAQRLVDSVSVFKLAAGGAGMPATA